MNISCHVIEDLLPLYCDAVCSDESRELVQEHLKDCDSCKKMLSDFQKEPVPVMEDNDDISPLKAIAQMWKKKKMRAFLKGAAAAVLVCAVVFSAYIGLVKWKCIPVSADLLEVSDVSRLADGRIIYHLAVKDGKNLHFEKFTTNEDGSYYITPVRSVIEDDESADGYYLVDIAESNAYEQRYGDGIVITSCYIGPVGQGVLIWEEGMELPPASEALEKMVK